MVQLKTQRTALVLYALLLVLPTAILGTLHWHELWRDHEARMDDVPMALEDAARRLSFSIEERVNNFVYGENHRPFFQFQDQNFPRGNEPWEPVLAPTPLNSEAPLDGMVCWFSYCFDDGPDAPFKIFDGSGDAQAPSVAEGYRETLCSMIASDWADSEAKRETRRNEVARFGERLPFVAINHALLEPSPESALLELRETFRNEPELSKTQVVVAMFGLGLRFLVEEDGTPYVLASRTILFEPNESLRKEDLHSLSRFAEKRELVQGFFIDAEWLFRELPRIEAATQLDRSMFLSPVVSESPPGMLHSQPVKLVKRLDLEIPANVRGFGYEAFSVGVSTRDLEAAFWRQSWRFFAVAALLAISLALGMLLLMRSVHKDLEQARRTENFVAAVTHELRTPLTAIRLYSEMLHDGWVSVDAKRREYYGRILRETERLETLVDRVLSKARLSSSPMPTRTGDLSQTVEHLLPAFLDQSEGRTADLAFAAEADLPPVHLNPDAVRSILTNLVENARKYAANPTHLEEGEAPILVRARRVGSVPVLEVCDRGAGIPGEERKRIFEAFYRVGTEATRTAKGTGLGLHLVAIQAKAMSGRAEVRQREGGGTIFRVYFKRAEGAQPAPTTAKLRDYELPRSESVRPENSSSERNPENEGGDAAQRAGAPS